jgi:SHS2 domain-containing protein
MVAYRLLDHTADLGFTCAARTLEGLFETAALALADIMARIEPLETTKTIGVQASAHDNAARLRALLDEVLFQFETHAFLPKEAHVTLHGDSVKATLKGQTIDLATYPVERVVKAITYHELEVEKTRKGFRARVILDL